MPNTLMTRRQVWRMVVTAWLSLAVLSGAAIALAVVNQRQQEKGWCDLITILDNGYRTPPGPQTPAGKAIAAAIAGRRASLHCDE